MWLAIFHGGSQIPPVRIALSASGVRGYAPAVALGGGRVGAAWNEAGHDDKGSAAVARVGRFLK